MGLAIWRQAGGQVKAPRITGFDTAFNPVIQHVQRLEDARRRKEAAEAEMQFRREESSKDRNFRQEESYLGREHQSSENKLNRDSEEGMFDKTYSLDEAKYNLDEKKFKEVKEQNKHENKLANRRLGIDEKLAKAKLNEINSKAEARRLDAEAKRRGYNIDLTSKVPIPLMFTGKTHEREFTTKERLETAKRNVSKTHKGIFDKEKAAVKELKDKFGISDNNQLQTTIQKLQEDYKGGDKTVKDKLDKLKEKSKFLMKVATVTGNEFDSIPKTVTVKEKTIDFTKYMPQFNKETTRTIQKILSDPSIPPNEARNMVNNYKQVRDIQYNAALKPTILQEQIRKLRVESEVKAASEEQKLDNDKLLVTHKANEKLRYDREKKN